MVQVRILNFFICLLLVTPDDFCLVPLIPSLIDGGLPFRRDLPRHIVTFRVTDAEKSEFPGDRAIRVRVVGEEISSLDSRAKVMAK